VEAALFFRRNASIRPRAKITQCIHWGNKKNFVIEKRCGLEYNKAHRTQAFVKLLAY
jgi:hypothetical protein